MARMCCSHARQTVIVNDLSEGTLRETHVLLHDQQAVAVKDLLE